MEKTCFNAEIKEFKKVKNISNDELYRVVLITADPACKKLIDFSSEKYYGVGIVEID